MALLQMREKADTIVQALAEVQRSIGTGYLSAYGEGLIDRNIAGKSVWAPFYTLHKILQGLIDQYTMCDNQTALEVARRMGDWAYNKLSPLSDETRRRMIRNEFGGFNEAMYNLYEITKDEKHLWVARFFYHDEKIDPLKKGDKQLGTHHANTLIPKALGEYRNYELFGNKDSRAAAELLFQTLTTDHAFVTGEVSDKEHLFDPKTQSKHLTGYNGESCCTYNLLKLASRIFTYDPRASIFDYYERALYNHILGQQDPASSMVCYFMPLQTGAYKLYSTRDSSFWCCVGTAFESHAKYAAHVYHHAGDTLYVNLFIPTQLNWEGTIIRQTGHFPQENKTTITISGKKRNILLRIRHPQWATYVKINGKTVAPDDRGYVTVRRTKKIEIEFGMNLHEQSTNDDSTRVALLYGPIVLAGELEEVQHPFSDPKKYNDYYTFDYGNHPDVAYSSLAEFKEVAPLSFARANLSVRPLCDIHHHRYVVYWKKQ